MRVDLDMMALTFNVAHHYLVTFILHVMAIQIILDLCLDPRVVGLRGLARNSGSSRNSRYISQINSLSRRAGEYVGGTYQCHKGYSYI